MNYIISIKHLYAERIYYGTKKYEIRTRIPKLQRYDYIFIYEPKPIALITGVIIVTNILKLTPQAAWDTKAHVLGITKDNFDEYCKSKEFIYLIGCDEVVKFNKPGTLSYFGFIHAPQWFVKISLQNFFKPIYSTHETNCTTSKRRL